MSAEQLVDMCCAAVRRHWPSSGGPAQLVLWNHMTKDKKEQVVVLSSA